MLIFIIHETNKLYLTKLRLETNQTKALSGFNPECNTERGFTVYSTWAVTVKINANFKVLLIDR